MPLSNYFGGGGAKVMDNMQKEYGPDKGKQVFYAKANKMKKKKMNIAPSKELMSKKGMM